MTTVQGLLTWLTITVAFVFVNCAKNAEIYQANCRTPLGMQNGVIPDENIHASSSYDPASVGAPYGRIRTERHGGAWCPKNQIQPNSNEWLEIDLGTLTRVTLVETQGRFGNGQGQEYAEHYKLLYKRTGDEEWKMYTNKKGQQIFLGNINTYIAELREVNPPIIARVLRFLPHSGHPRTVCMRVEVYGCAWDEGILSYSMPQGERRGSEIDLFDFTYDGKENANKLSGGLGQLVDGEKGPTNFSNDGLTYASQPIIYEYMRDTLMEFARLVIISIRPPRVGKVARVRLYFDARWLMISELNFESEPVSLNETEGLSGEAPRLLTEYSGEHTTQPAAENKPPGSQRSMGLSAEQLIGIVVGVSAVAVVLFAVAIVCVVLRVRRKADKSKKTNIDLGHFGNMGSATQMPATINGKLLNGNMYKSVATGEVGDQTREVSEINDNTVLSTEPLYKQDYHIQSRQLPDVPPYNTSLTSSELVDSGTETCTSRDYAVPSEILHQRSTLQLHSRGLPPADFRAADSAPPPMPSMAPPAALYAASDVVQRLPADAVPGVHPAAALSSGSLYACLNTELFWKDDLDLVEFNKANLKFISQLGEGHFGEVHMAEASNMTEVLGDDFLVNRTSASHSTMRVAVKMLRQDADDAARADFYKEIKIMSRLKDPNVVRVIGVCTQEEPMCVIVEYMKHGDLHEYLQRHTLDTTNATLQRPKKGSKTLSHGCLVYMATQVASGMKYLESMNMVHRDLATRNCLVGHAYTIKISDFGMSRALYSGDYYRVEGKAMLPIRWMAWESVLLGKFSSKSDVWSFAVTLWEILSFARQQPFDGMTDEQIIENCGHYYRCDNEEIILNQPSNCPKEIFDLMRECWNRNEGSRPAFREIHMFLQRKNIGFNPQEERYGFHGHNTHSLARNSKMSVPLV